MSTVPPTRSRAAPARSPWIRGIGSLIFFSRWLQAPLYVGLIVAQGIYVAVFISEIWVLWNDIEWSHPNGAAIMLGVLGLIDVVMIANLLIMVIIGGYETFVSRIKTEGHPDQPEWLSHVNANVLKVKLAMAIIGISSIHLLKTFIEVAAIGPGGVTVDDTDGSPATYTSEGVMWQVIIHCVFILSALALAAIDRMSQPKHAHASPAGAHVVYPAHPGAATAPPESTGGAVDERAELAATR